MINPANLWFFCALIAAVVWGFSYAVSERVMKDGLSPAFIMLATGFFYFFISLLIANFSGSIKPGFEILTENKKTFLNLLIMSFSFILGSLLIYYAIGLKNATLVNLIEITYPVFTLMFAYLLYKEVQINLSVLIGGALIFTGVAIIYLKA